jgi:hypothetical protein
MVGTLPRLPCGRSRPIEQKYMDSRLKIVGKDEVHEALGLSPDSGDTFLMRMYFELLGNVTAGTHEQVAAAIHRGPVPRKPMERGV